MKRFAAAAALAATLVSPASAQVSPEIIEATAGWWFLANAEDGLGCNLQLVGDEAIGGHAVNVPDICRIGQVAGDDIAAWNFNGNGQMVFLDATRGVLFTLDEQEYGAWTEDAPDGSFVLTPSAAGVLGLPIPGSLAGAWHLDLPGKPKTCRVLLSPDPPPGGEESFGLKVTPDCDAAILKLKLASWRVEGVELAFYGTDGARLAFHADGNGGYVEAGSDPARAARLRKI